MHRSVSQTSLANRLKTLMTPKRKRAGSKDSKDDITHEGSPKSPTQFNLDNDEKDLDISHQPQQQQEQSNKSSLEDGEMIFVESPENLRELPLYPKQTDGLEMFIARL